MIVSTGFAQSEISVSASAEVSTQPEVAEFRLAIMARQQLATDAFSTYLSRYNALRNSLDKIVDSTKLVTSNLSITPFFNYKNPEHMKPEYYQVSTSMSLSVPVSKMNAILGRVASIDGVTINGISFEAKDREKMEIEALEMATKKAQSKAAAIAKLEGLTDLKVKNLNTSVSRPPVPFFGGEAMMATAAVEPSVTPSSISVTATINVTYTATQK